MAILHKSGEEIVLNFESEWARSMSRDAFVWWMTQTSFFRYEAFEEAKAVFNNPDHPDHAHACEVMALFVAERLKR